jgi:NitT/TauT family transport system substrate-binding protein
MIRMSLFLFLVLMCNLLSGQLPKVTFTPHWLPQAQFAGYYVASDKGFYLDEGIEVEIIHPPASVMASDWLKNGKSDIISLFLTSALTARDKGINLVNIAQISQNSALLFVTKKGSNISKLSDLDGKKIGIWQSGFDEIPKDLIYANNYKVEWVPILSSINMFMLGGVDAMTVMWYNEYKQIINAGVNTDELNTFFFSDYGYNIPEDGLYCLEETRSKRKNDLDKFVRATLKGWEYARTNRQETLEIVTRWMKREYIATNLSHQKWMLDRWIDLIEPGSKNVKKGELAETDFLKTRNILFDGKYVNKKISFNEFYKPMGAN